MGCGNVKMLKITTNILKLHRKSIAAGTVHFLQVTNSYAGFSGKVTSAVSDKPYLLMKTINLPYQRVPEAYGYFKQY